MQEKLLKKVFGVAFSSTLFALSFPAKTQQSVSRTISMSFLKNFFARREP